MITVKYWIIVDKGWQRVDKHIQEAWVPHQIETCGMYKTKTEALREKRKLSYSKRLEVAEIEINLHLVRLETKK